MNYKVIVFSIMLLSFLLSCDDNTTEPDKPEVLVGQVWMMKNLDVDHYRTGEKIPQVTDPVEWAKLTTGAWCYYNNDPLMGKVYGKLYNKYALNDLRQLAPQGWHIARMEDWVFLKSFLGGEDVAGGKMKEQLTSHWLHPNTGATDFCGFKALPGGMRDFEGKFSEIYIKCYFWEVEEVGYTFAKSLSYNDNKLDDNAFKSYNYGFSVRCVKD